MPRIILFPYKVRSRSASRLQEYLEEEGADCVKVYPDRNYQPRADDLIIGWGSGDWPAWRRAADRTEATWLNPSDKIIHSVNKQTTFSLFNAAHIPCPEYTSRSSIARRWLLEGHTVLARQEIEGRDGSGLVVMESGEDLVEANLYTKYQEKTAEYRVHVFTGEAFWAQERVPIEEEANSFYRENPDQRIRVSKNGWTLYIANRTCPRSCFLVAIQAVSALGLDFGAVDIGYNSRNNQVCVYEVNTAPELSDRTCSAYVEQILAMRRI